MRGLIEAVEECEGDAETKGILLTSSNKSIFCGGLELQEMVEKDEGYKRHIRYNNTVGWGFGRVTLSRKTAYRVVVCDHLCSYMKGQLGTQNSVICILHFV